MILFVSSSLNKRCQAKAKTFTDVDEKENLERFRSRLPDYFSKKKEHSEVKIEKEKTVDQSKIG